MPDPWKRLGSVLTPARPSIPRQALRTITDSIAGEGKVASSKTSAEDRFNYGRHKWLKLVARDGELTGAAYRVAILLWQLQNPKQGCAWPSLVWLATELGVEKSTVTRALKLLSERNWIIKTRWGGRQRTNQYRISFGPMDETVDD